MTTANTAAAGAPRITVIDPRAPERAKLRVAAYARVSSDSDDQINSYIAQVDFYSKYIASKEDWEMVDIYADEGITGLEARRRDDFNRMMEDCRAGKIDRAWSNPSPGLPATPRSTFNSCGSCSALGSASTSKRKILIRGK